MVYPTITKVGIKKAVFPTSKWKFRLIVVLKLFDICLQRT